MSFLDLAGASENVQKTVESDANARRFPNVQVHYRFDNLDLVQARCDVFPLHRLTFSYLVAKSEACVDVDCAHIAKRNELGGELRAKVKIKLIASGKIMKSEKDSRAIFSSSCRVRSTSNSNICPQTRKVV